ncbi:MAG: chorismate-binding protein [Muribaculaceae bacterium]|nr:chorismate-binding protein [Muribaculaceae bacterium]
MDSFFLYSLPFSENIEGGEGNVIEGLHNGFYLSSFSGITPASVTIVPETRITPDDLHRLEEKYCNSSQGKEIFPFPTHTVSKYEHIERVKRIQSQILKKEKVVCCKTVCGEGKINLKETFLNLKKSFPEAMKFCFHTPQSGTWIGATPETLLKKENRVLHTMALAGTRSAEESGDWDNKNIEEQRMVADYIYDIISSKHYSFSWNKNPISRKTGLLQHLCTEFEISLKENFSKDNLLSLLSDLSPTPALCGYPKKKAMEIIKATENFKRGYYGGFFGPYNADKDFAFFVLLRALKIKGNKWCMFAAGGIVEDSRPEEEWDETEKKARSILTKLHYKKE